MRVSIVLATYNGGKYLYEQLTSIICQMDKDDELIISDDGPSDETIKIIEPFLKNSNTVLLSGPGMGVKANFENGIRYSHGEIVLICDQDDIWFSNKLDTIKRVFQSNHDKVLVMHNADYIDGDGNKMNESIYGRRNGHTGYWKSIFFSSYYGCCMAIKRDFLMACLPFPSGVLYDQYLGACAERIKKSLFINDILISHREHLNNWSQKQSLANRVFYRFLLLQATFFKRNELETYRGNQ